MRTASKVLLVACILATSLSFPALSADHQVLMTGDYGGAMFFDPVIITVNVGDRVRWFNNVAVIHTATSGAECAPDGQWTTGSIDPGGTSAYVTFDAAGSYAYYCRFHCGAGMTGEVVVSSVVRTRPSTWGKIKALYRP